MPLTEEQEEALTVLVGADPKDVEKGLKAKINSVWTNIFNGGHQKATKLAADAVTEAEGERDTAKADLKKAQDELTVARAGAPDVEKVRGELQKEIDRLALVVKEKEKEVSTTLDTVAKDSALSVMDAMMLDPAIGSFRKSWLAAIKADSKVADRIKVLKDRAIEVYQDGKEIPLQHEGDTLQDKLKALVLELKETYTKKEPESIAVPVDDGSGVSPTTGGAQDTGYDPVKEGKAMAEKQAGNKDLHALAMR